MRITIPDNANLLITLAKAISAKHATLATTSPLNGINGIETLATLASSSDDSNQQAEQLYEQAKTARETRDNMLGYDNTTPGTVRYLVTAARTVLAGQNKGSEHKLGDWGFDVIASTAVTPESKAAKAAAKAAKSKPVTA